MKHVKQIKLIIDQGQSDEAFEALDQLLALGPSNTEALKLKASLLNKQGRFEEEFKVWADIISIDNEDPDAISFFQFKHIEERENYYFADDMPNGGRRYIAYPRKLLRSSMVALTGCLAFLIFAKFSEIYTQLQTSINLIAVFALCVLGPWTYTMYNWLFALKSISMDKVGIHFETRFKTKMIPWKDVDQAWLAHSLEPSHESLHLVLVTKNSHALGNLVEVDLSQTTSSIRARSFFLKDVTGYFGLYGYITRDKVVKKDLKLISF